MRHLERIKAEPLLWLVMLLAGGGAAWMLYLALTGITY